MADPDAPFHAHIYYSADQRPAGEALRDQFIRLTEPVPGDAASAVEGANEEPRILFVGRMMDHGVGPHPIAQYEIHFLERSLGGVVAAIEASGLRALVHPLTDDDLADHSSLAQWIGEPVELDLSVLDPPGQNQGVARFGKSDF